MSILVTGGAGYIGAHVVLALQAAGLRPLVIDDLSTGLREAVPVGVTFVEGSTGDAALLREVMRDHRVEAVIHLAASLLVPESVARPLDYWRNNVANTLTLVETCAAAKVRQLVFSSTAAVYGESTATVVTEDAPCAPISPYGATKLAAERLLADAGPAHGLRHVALRYFNVAGADPAGRAGQRARGPTHLIEVACEAALGLRPEVTVFGTDWPTPDGTGIRDYIHVSDLAEAHVAALAHLAQGGGSLTLNCGYGRGHSVREVLAAVGRAAGRSVPHSFAQRRAGDAAALVAGTARLRAALDWQPRNAGLDGIVANALAWKQRMLTAIQPSMTGGPLNWRSAASSANRE